MVTITIGVEAVLGALSSSGSYYQVLVAIITGLGAVLVAIITRVGAVLVAIITGVVAIPMAIST